MVAQKSPFLESISVGNSGFSTKWIHFTKLLNSEKWAKIHFLIVTGLTVTPGIPVFKSFKMTQIETQRVIHWTTQICFIFCFIERFPLFLKHKKTPSPPNPQPQGISNLNSLSHDFGSTHLMCLGFMMQKSWFFFSQQLQENQTMKKTYLYLYIYIYI